MLRVALSDRLERLLTHRADAAGVTAHEIARQILSEALGAASVGLELQEPREAVLFPEISQPRAAPALESEIAWRIDECVADHLYARDAFYRDATGRAPSIQPDMSSVREEIRKALLRHDRARLTSDLRRRWRWESPVRASGIGIFYDPWCTGRHPQNDATNGGRRYLDPSRPWYLPRGKPDPVLRFAQLYFEVRDQHEAAAQ